jgi:hypothetical protein
MAPPLTGETGKTAYRRYRPYAERDAGEDKAQVHSGRSEHVPFV